MSDSLDIAQDGHLFPRQEVTREVARAIASEDWRDRPVPFVAWALAALGVTLVALGLPIERVLVTAPTEFAAEGSRLGAQSPLHALARALGATGIGIEAAFFALSATAFGASLLALGAVLRSVGLGGRLGFVCALIALASPLVVHHARLPSTVTFAVLGSSLVMWALVDRRRASVTRVAIGLVGAWLLAASTFGAGAAQDPFGGIDGLPALGALWAALPLTYFVRSAEESLPPVWLMAWCVASLVCAVACDVPGGAAVPAFAVLLAGALIRFARAEVAGRVAAGTLAIQAGLAILVVTPRPNVPALLADGINSLDRGDAVVLSARWPKDLQRYLLERRVGAEVIESRGGIDWLRAEREGRLRPLISSPTGGTGEFSPNAER